MSLLRTFRKRLDESLQARAVASNVLLIAFFAFVLLSLVLLLQRDALRGQLHLRARMLAEFVAVQSAFPMMVGNRPELERIVSHAVSIEDVQLVVLQDAQGGNKIDSRRPGSRPHSFLEVIVPVATPSGSLADWEPRRQDAAPQGAVLLRISVERQTRLFWHTVLSVVGAAVAALIFILGVLVHQLRAQLKPLQGLIEFTRRVGEGDLSYQAVVERPDEVGRLTMAFNNMVEKLSLTTVSKKHVDDVIRSMNESLIVLDTDARIKTVNQATLGMLGYSEAELIGRPVDMILQQPADRAASDASAGESVYRTSDGTLVPILLSRAQMQTAAGGSHGEVWVAQDITGRIRTERELRKAKSEAEEANRAKSEFLSRTSHELRTPLNAILGFAQLLMSGDTAGRDRESVEQILKGGRHLLHLINEVLDIAGIESGRRTLSMEPVDASAAADEAVALIRPVAAQRNIQIANRMPSGTPCYVMADYQRLKQVLLNLISNAVKYNREAGHVTLSCAVSRERLRISITDEGPGLPPGKLDRLFIPFERLGAEQTAIEGSGLGLAVSKTLVGAMSGEMGYETAPGKGSTFWFELNSAASPLLPDSNQPPKTAPPLLPTTAEVPCTVLYIEDTSSNIRLMERVLEFRPQVRLVSATCGLDGLRAVRSEDPDLILLDVHLPDMNGDEVLRILKVDPASRNIPVVVLSADATPRQIDRLIAGGARAYLTKPLDLPELLLFLDEAINNKVLTHA